MECVNFSRTVIQIRSIWLPLSSVCFGWKFTKLAQIGSGKSSDVTDSVGLRKGYLTGVYTRMETLEELLQLLEQHKQEQIEPGQDCVSLTFPTVHMSEGE